MSGIAVQVVVILLLIVANGVFAMAELAIASSRRVRLQRRAAEGDAGARAALELAGDPGRFLSTVQIGITLIGILTGAFGGPSLGSYVAHGLARVPFLGRYSEALGLGLVVVAITYLSLVIGELVPKQLALGNAEGIAGRVARPMQLLSGLAAPAVWLLSASTALVVRLLGVRPAAGPAVTEDEIRLLIEQGTAAGVFHEAEQQVVERVFRLGDRRVADLMTPRPRVVWLDVAAPPEAARRAMAASPHHFFPDCRGDLDHVVGVVSVKDLWARAAADEPVDLAALARPVLVVPEGTPAFKALEAFRRAGASLALVVDEFGGIEGLLTLTDLLEALVGDFPAAPGGEPRAVRREDGSWLVDGLLPVDAFREAVPAVGVDPGRVEYQTVGGLVLARLGRIPRAGDRFEWGGLRFEVVDMDGNRVDQVLVTPAAGRPGAAAEPTAPPPRRLA
jgi:putative hemolysin